MPTILIVAGPNGAGKTSFVREWFARAGDGFAFLNADELARDLADSGLTGAELNLAAGRRMLEQLDARVREGRDLVVETTLATRVHARRIPLWRRAGYRVELIYLRLPSVEASLARVSRRVAAGGHGIPAADIRRRFARSLANLEMYKPLVDRWEVWDSVEGAPILAEWSEA